MKKMLSMLLAAVMLISAVPAAYATNDYQAGTQVEYVAANNESYTITVPAKLTPGQSGTVTLNGIWPSNKTISVTAEPTVTLTNSILASDQKVLDITFLGISKAGNDTAAKTYSETVSVESIENALFGTWSGKFNYNVDFTTQQVNGEIVYNVWYRAENSDNNNSMSLLFTEDKTFVHWKMQGITFMCSGTDGTYDRFDSIAADGKSFITIEDDVENKFIMDESTLNTELTYCTYKYEDRDSNMYLVFTPGTTWAEYCNECVIFTQEMGLMTDVDDRDNPYHVMDANNIRVRGTDIMVENATYYAVLPPKLITFTLDGECSNVNGTYQAEEGMNWGTWLQSDYNTANLKEDNGFIFDEGGNYFMEYSLSDEITNGRTYYLGRYAQFCMCPEPVDEDGNRICDYCYFDILN